MNDIRIADKVSRTQFSLFMRQLHILALVQHGGSSEKLNCTTMADLLSYEPGKENLSPKMIRDSVPRLAEMGFPVQTEQGSPRIWLERELAPHEMLEVLPYYLNIVTDTVGIRDCFKSYVDTHKSRSLWIIARIYFASLEKKQIELMYRSKYKTEAKKYTLKPYRWIYRDNAVYLVARNISSNELGIKKTDNEISLFRLNRISDLKVTEKTFEDEIPSTEELLRHSIGAFIGSEYHDVRLNFRPEEKENIEEDFGQLELEFSDTGSDGLMHVFFTVCDLVNLCKTVFGYCGRVKITGDAAAVSQMKEMLGGNSIY